MGEETRIGVYVCHCGKNISAVVDTSAVADFASSLDNVVVARENSYCCAETGQAQIINDIKEHNLNRVVVASCSPKLHEPTFRRTVSEAGLNPYLMEMVNIREHCSWVHMREPDAATKKAMDLVKMGVAKAGLLKPLTDREVSTTKTSLVIGGGVAGLQAAIDIANAGHHVYLVEKSPTLGGKVAQLSGVSSDHQSPGCLLTPMMTEAIIHPNIDVFTNAEVKSVDGYIGNFKVKIIKHPRYVNENCNLCGECSSVCPVEVKDEFNAGMSSRKAIYLPFEQATPSRYVIDMEQCTRCGLCVESCPVNAIDLEVKEEELELDIGSIVVATGFESFNPQDKTKYSYSQFKNVITSLQLERMLDPEGPTEGKLIRPSDGKKPTKIAFIQCVGSRDEEGNQYCSKICCMSTVKQAKILKNLYPEIDITVYYRDIRLPRKELEHLYREVKEAGVLFVRGDIQEVSETEDNNLLINVHSETLNRTISRDMEMVILAVGLEPCIDGNLIKEIVKVPTSPDGFFMEAHPKLKPIDTVIDGVYLAGACLGPKDIAESIAQASGTAAKVCGLFSKDRLKLDGIISKVDPDVCNGCGICIKQCPFQAIIEEKVGEEKKAKVVEAACKGCGVCAGACPTSAIEAFSFTTEQIHAQIGAALEENPGEKIIAFCCNWCSYAGADFAGVSRLQYPSNVRIIRTMCSGRLSKDIILYAFEKGAGMVLVSGCHPPGDCHYVSGNYRCEERVNSLMKALPKKGIDPKRLRLEWVSAAEGVVFQRIVKEMAEQLKDFPNLNENVRGEK
ncbi:MAG: hydrogenase iron-sulfur subunit [Pseudomonadota bacterium]